MGQAMSAMSGTMQLMQETMVQLNSIVSDLSRQLKHGVDTPSPHFSINKLEPMPVHQTFMPSSRRPSGSGKINSALDLHLSQGQSFFPNHYPKFNNLRPETRTSRIDWTDSKADVNDIAGLMISFVNRAISEVLTTTKPSINSCLYFTSEREIENMVYMYDLESARLGNPIDLQKFILVDKTPNDMNWEKMIQLVIEKVQAHIEKNQSLSSSNNINVKVCPTRFSVEGDTHVWFFQFTVEKIKTDIHAYKHHTIKE